MNERKGRKRERERANSVATYRNRRSVRRCIVMSPSSTTVDSPPTQRFTHTVCVRVYIPPPFTTHRLVPSLSTTARSLCTWSRAPRFSTYTLLVLQPAIRFVLVHSPIPFRSWSIDRLGHRFTAVFRDRRSSEEIATVDRLGKATPLAADQGRRLFSGYSTSKSWSSSFWGIS